MFRLETKHALHMASGKFVRLLVPVPVVLSLFFCIPSLAQETQSPTESVGATENSDKVYDHFHMIDDLGLKIDPLSDELSPLTLMGHVIENAVDLAAKSQVSLLKWIRFEGIIGKTPVDYDRNEHFGGRWIDDPTDNTCLNTRQKILERSSVVPVEFAPTKRCKAVVRGEWHDPYTGNTYTNPADIDIDHVVALKNAYVNAAYKWGDKKRCLFANYIANDFHLLAVDAPQNRIKADHSPASYIPPNDDYVCEFLSNWLKVKLIWDIPLDPPEAAAIDKHVKNYSCDRSKMKFSRRDLQQQRKNIIDLQSICTTLN